MTKPGAAIFLSNGNARHALFLGKSFPSVWIVGLSGFGNDMLLLAVIVPILEPAFDNITDHVVVFVEREVCHVSGSVYFLGRRGDFNQLFNHSMYFRDFIPVALILDWPGFVAV